MMRSVGLMAVVGLVVVSAVMSGAREASASGAAVERSECHIINIDGGFPTGPGTEVVTPNGLVIISCQVLAPSTDATTVTILEPKFDVGRLIRTPTGPTHYVLIFAVD